MVTHGIIRFKRSYSGSKEHIKETKIADSVLLSLSMSSNVMVQHCQRTGFSGTLFNLTQNEHNDPKRPDQYDSFSIIIKGSYIFVCTVSKMLQLCFVVSFFISDERKRSLLRFVFMSHVQQLNTINITTVFCFTLVTTASAKKHSNACSDYFSEE